MLVVRVEIDTQSFLHHACEQHATFEEFQSLVEEELCRAMRSEHGMIPIAIWHEITGEVITVPVKDPYRDMPNYDEDARAECSEGKQPRPA